MIHFMKPSGNIARRNLRELGRELGSGLLELAWPTRCAICDMPGSLLCEECDAKLPRIDHAKACPRCGAPYGRIVCTECWNRNGFIEHGFAHATCAASYGKETARLVKCYKDHGELGLARVLADLVWEALMDDPDAFAGGMPEVLTYVPATPAALLRRGYDHMQIVADELSCLSGLGILGAFEKLDAEDQRSLGRLERMRNMAGTFELACGSEDVEGKRILLVDDVFTTGATLDEASRVLYGAGAGIVTVATVCRVW